MRNQKSLDIVSFDVPWPANYGGVIDVYYKIKALAEEGVNVNLHTFQYGREEARELEEICASVHYYPRKIFRDPFFSNKPYIVNTRCSGALLKNLKNSDNPVLFEGLHCCYYIDHPSLSHKKKIVRMHNIEHLYYKNLAKVEKNPFKRYFFLTESKRLQRYQRKLTSADEVAAISPSDHKTLNLKYGNSFYLPVFHNSEELHINSGRGEFVLYHGNLSVGENNEAALYLIREVFSQLHIPLIIAGSNPSDELREAINGKRNIKLCEELSPEGIQKLIKKAHINLLPTFQNTGIKLKLINVLFNGRFCLVNKPMIKNTGLEELCYEANTPKNMQEQVKNLFEKEFKKEESERRAEILETFNNRKNAQKLINHIYD